MGLPQYEGVSYAPTVRKWFSGATALRSGQVLCYDPTAPVTTDVTLGRRRGQAVAALAAANVNLVAGFVAPSEAGRIGPCWIDLVVPSPGDTAVAEVDGLTDVAVGDLLVPDVARGALVRRAPTVSAGEAAFTPAFRALQAQTVDGRVAVLVHRP